MSSNPTLWLGGAAGIAARPGTTTSLHFDASMIGSAGSNTIDYGNLISSANIMLQSGTKVLRLWSTAVDSASMRLVNAGVITAAEQQANLKLLKAIADYCNANGIVVSVEDDFRQPVAYGDDWAKTAKSVNLPVAYVDTGEVIVGKPDSPGVLNALAQVTATYAAAIAKYYPNIKFGDTEPPVDPGNPAGRIALIQHWWAAFAAANAQHGLAGYSYFVADLFWNTPTEVWQPAMEQITQAAHASGLQAGVFMVGSANVSGQQWADQVKQHIAELAANPAIDLDFMVAETWTSAVPNSSVMLTDPGSMGNIGLALNRLYPLYRAGLITATQAVKLTVDPQAVVQLGVAKHIGLQVALDPGDANTGHRAALMIVSQTGNLSVPQLGTTIISGNGTNRLAITGTAADLTAMLANLTITETMAGPDTVTIQSLNTNGVWDTKSTAVVAQNGAATSFVGNGLTGWNTSSVVISQGKIVSEHLTWPTSDVGATGYVPVHTIPVYTPLYDASVIVSNGRLINAKAQGAGPYYDPTVYEHFMATIASTDITFSAAGEMQTVIDHVAADHRTDLGHAVPFANGGTIRTEYNTGNNPNWGGWGSGLASFQIITDSSGRLIQTYARWKDGSPYVDSIRIYSPDTGKLWQTIDAMPSGTSFVTGDKFVTEYNTGDNPNWNAVEWGNDVWVQTRISDYFPVSITHGRPDGGVIVISGETPADTSKPWYARTEIYDPFGRLVSDTYTWKGAAGAASAPSLSGTAGNAGGQGIVGNWYIYQTAIGNIAMGFHTGGGDTLWDVHPGVLNDRNTINLNGQNYIAGPGNDFLTVTGNGTVSGGAGSNAITARDGNMLMISEGFHDTIRAGSGFDTLVAHGGPAFLLGGSGPMAVGSNANSTVAGGSGPSTVWAGANNVIFGGSGPMILSLATGDTIAGGTGDLTAYTNDSGSIIWSGAGRTIVAGGHSTVVGGTGTLQVGAGDDVAVAVGQGDATVWGGNRTAVFAGPGKLTFVGGNGDATVVGGTRPTTMFGGQGSHNVYAGDQGAVMIGGDIMSAAFGTNSTLVGSGGSNLMWGSPGNDVFWAGGGTDTVVGGSGRDTVAISQGVGGITFVMDFHPTEDTVALVGYDRGEADRALSRSSTAGGSTTITLSDNTRITFVNMDIDNLRGHVTS